MIVLREFTDKPHIKHAFFTRKGGVSNGVYSSLNCSYGSQDQKRNVDANRQLVLERQGFSSAVLVTCRQVHSSKVVFVRKPWVASEGPEADGMVTNMPNITLGILSADCAPILFADPLNRIIGAAHAGWKGALNGIVEKTLAKMIKHGADYNNIRVAIGPCIGKKSYEVGTDFRDRFIRADESNIQFFYDTKKPGHNIFHLQKYIKHRLLKAGVRWVFDTKHDTFTDDSNFFSYRRSVLYGEPDYGCGISTITLMK